MIDPVRGVTSYQGTPKVTRRSAEDVSGGTPFSLEQALTEQEASQEGVVYEHGPAVRGEQQGAARGEAERERERSEARETAEAEVASAQNKLFGFFETELTPEAFLKGVREFLARAVTNLRQMFSNFWESKPLTEGRADGVGTGNASGEISAPEDGDLGIPEDDFDRGIDALEPADARAAGREPRGASQTGYAAAAKASRGVPARNTSILTQYDARGRIVTPDPSDTQRILHGDRGSRNL